MEIINVDRSNIDTEHICCAISDKKGECCVESKKEWMKGCFDDGLVFKKLNTRGKVLIEYIPAENAWCPVEAEGYMFVDCFWVSGQFKDQGYANKLLDACIEESKRLGKKGLVALSSKKKMPFLSDPGYYKHRGFKVCDTAAPHFELLVYQFNEARSGEQESMPRFRDCCRAGTTDHDKGFVLYYSNHCPHTVKYVPVIEKAAADRGVGFKSIRICTKEQARNAPSAFTTYSLFYNGRFVTNEILSEGRFNKLMNEKGL